MREDSLIDALRKANAGVPDQEDIPPANRDGAAFRVGVRPSQVEDWRELKDRFDVSENTALLEAMIEHCLKTKL